MDKKGLVIYHDDADGFCSAFLFWQLYRDTLDFLKVNYGEDPPDLAEIEGREVYIVDFSYPREQLISMSTVASKIVVLDHHKTAQKDLRGIKLHGKYSKTIFDMNKSGCMLAWEYIYGNTMYPWIVSYVTDRDLWTWKLSKSKETNSAIASYERDFQIWDNMIAKGLYDIIKEGEVILRYQDILIKQIAQHSFREINPEDGVSAMAIVNSPVLQSEVGHYLCETNDVALVYYVHKNNKVTCSLRSAGKIDVSALAKLHNGGGHHNAAGFETEPEEFFGSL